MRSAVSDLTGTWHGIFNYPRLMPPNSFTATLIDRAGALTGETIEQCDDTVAPAGEITAILTGARHGSGVQLEKRYDDLARAAHIIHYAGSIHDEGHEIRGRWLIPNVWSGTFVMVRARVSEVPAEAVLAEPVP